MEWNKAVMMAAVLMIGGCASQTPAPVTSDLASFEPNIRCGADVAPEERVKLEMVDTLMARDRNFAALAQLQSSEQNNQEYWQRYGELLAKTGDLPRAERLFIGMRDKCDSSEAYHGLGMVALKQGKLDQSLALLEMAVNRMPASAAARNDYGYALLLKRDFPQAQMHLRTALELQNGNGTARQNLAVAYLLEGNEKGMKLLQTQYHLTDDELAFAKRLAQGLGV